MWTNRARSRNPDGFMGEAVMSTDISDTNRQLYEGRLMHDFSLQSLLPGDHPYRNNRPFV
jgi:hypothetical protein